MLVNNKANELSQKFSAIQEQAEKEYNEAMALIQKGIDTNFSNTDKINFEILEEENCYVMEELGNNIISRSTTFTLDNERVYINAITKGLKETPKYNKADEVFGFNNYGKMKAYLKNLKLIDNNSTVKAKESWVLDYTDTSLFKNATISTDRDFPKMQKKCIHGLTITLYSGIRK